MYILSHMNYILELQLVYLLKCDCNKGKNMFWLGDLYTGRETVGKSPKHPHWLWMITVAGCWLLATSPLHCFITCGQITCSLPMMTSSLCPCVLCQLMVSHLDHFLVFPLETSVHGVDFRNLLDRPENTHNLEIYHLLQVVTVWKFVIHGKIISKSVSKISDHVWDIDVLK